MTKIVGCLVYCFILFVVVGIQVVAIYFVWNVILVSIFGFFHATLLNCFSIWAAACLIFAFAKFINEDDGNEL